MKLNSLDGKGSGMPTPHAAPMATNNDIASFKKHSRNYFTVEGIIRRTGLSNKIHWYIVIIEELLDNAVDFIQKYYRAHKDTTITLYVTKIKRDSLLHIKIRNTHTKPKIQVFRHIDKIFDTSGTFGTKQNDKVISRGLLGDALKQILAFAYVLLHCSNDDDRKSFVNAQWDKPLIIRHNGIETHVKITVDDNRDILYVKDVGVVEGGNTDTEIELYLPIIPEVEERRYDGSSSNDGDIIRSIEKFCRLYAMQTTDITLKFRLDTVE